MQKFIIEADVDDAALLALLQIILPGKASIKRLVTCEECKYCLTLPQFPDRPYCEGRLFGKSVDHQFFCADGENR